MYYAFILSAVYARDFKQSLVLLVTWPSNPEASAVSGGWLLSTMMSSVERQYTHAEQNMQVWYGVVWYGMVWYGVVWRCTAVQ